MNFKSFLFATLAVLSFGSTSHAAERTFSFTVLEIPDIQRGAGLAIVMRTPSGKTWLYDTGTAHPERLSSDGWLAKFNAGRDVVTPLLKKQGITSIDGVFISHAHYDHFGGLLWLKENFEIKKLIDCGYTFHSDNPDDYLGTNKEELDHYDRVREEFQARGAHITATAGETLNLDPDLKIEVIAPPKSCFKDPKITTRPKNDTPSHFLVNANSLALRIQFGDIVFLLPGDIQTEDIEASLMPFVDKSKLKCHILVAPGHGIHPIPQAFGDATRPEVSIASVFPRYAKGIRSTATLKALGTKTFVTGLHGTVQVVTDGKTYQVTSERDDEMPKTSPPKDIVFKSTLDGTEQRYVELLPPAFDTDKQHDVVIALHGHGSDRWQFINQTRGECQGVRDVAAKHGMIVVSPDYRAKTSWMGPQAEADVVQIIAELKVRHKVGRVFIAGGSMGGTSALIFAALHPELIAGVCSLNGTANMVEYTGFKDAIDASYGSTEERRKRSAELLSDKFSMPVAVTTGGKDDVVPPQSVLSLVEKLKQAGRDVLSIHRENGGHSTTYEDTVVAMEFVLQHAR